MSDRTLNDPPWVVEIDGIKFATPEAVVILLQSVSEERDALEAQAARLREAGCAALELLDKYVQGSAYDDFKDELAELLDA